MAIVVCVRMRCKHRKKELTWGKAGYRGKSKTIPSSALLALSSPLIVTKVRVLFVFSGQRRNQARIRKISSVQGTSLTPVLGTESRITQIQGK